MQLEQMEKLGGLGGLMSMMPGIGKMKSQMANAGMDDRAIKRQKAIIDSMTRKERRNPKLMDGSRRKRIAAGSGTKVEDVNRLMKMHRQMADMMKQMGASAGKRGGGPMAGLANMFGLGGGGGMGGMGGGMPKPEDLAKMAEKMGGMGGGMPSLPAKFPGNLPGLPGGAKPGGLPGFPGFPPKKK